MGADIACVVEGHGDREAVPILIRRIANAVSPPVRVRIQSPLRIPKDKLLKQGELERAVELAARKVGPGGGILVLLDSDDDCPAKLGRGLLERALRQRKDKTIAVVLAKREFEAWFLAAADSLKGKRGLSPTLAPPSAPEEIRGAKEWLADRKVDGTAYSETLDQPALAACFDMDAARRSDSFDKFYREVSRLLTGALAEP